MKIFAMALIIICSISFGNILHKKEEEKLRKAELLISLLEDIKTYMKCSLYSTKDIFIKLSKVEEYKTLGFVNECVDNLIMGQVFPAAYKTAADNHIKLFPCQIKETILSLGQKLGTTDLSGQLSYIDLALEKLNRECELIRVEYKKKENMYLPLSVLTGIAIAIVIY